jgi:hypothetical protein
VSLLDDHPGPWTEQDGRFVDADGVGLTGPGPMRAILAAPEMMGLLAGYPVRPRGVGLFSPLHQQRVLDWQSRVALLLAELGEL